LDRDEEWLAEAEASARAEWICERTFRKRRVGERPALSGDVRTVVRARAVLARGLEAEFVERALRERRGEAADERVRRVLLDRVRTAPPRVDVEGTVVLLRPGVVIAEVGEVLRAQAVVGLEQEDAGVVGAVDRAVL